MKDNEKSVTEEQKVEQNSSVITSERIVEEIKNAQNKWDGRKINKTLKTLFIITIIITIILEIFAYVWPRVESIFPEIKSTEEKCKTAVCPKICNGECECTYKNKYDVEEKVTCIVK